MEKLSVSPCCNSILCPDSSERKALVAWVRGVSFDDLFDLMAALSKVDRSRAVEDMAFFLACEMQDRAGCPWSSNDQQALPFEVAV